MRTKVTMDSPIQPAIAFYGSTHLPKATEKLISLVEAFKALNYELLFDKALYKALCNAGYLLSSNAAVDKIPNEVKFVVSYGGDGSFLNCLHNLENPNTPIWPINSGHLGFLADITPDEALAYVDDIDKCRYSLDERKLIGLYNNGELVMNAFNEIAIERHEIGGLIHVDTWVNNSFLARYSGNGLLIATPSGSTAYSLSLNGPIIDPMSEVLVLTPIAPHTLNLRPMVVPDSVDIDITVTARAKDYSVTVDGKIFLMPIESALSIKLSGKRVRIVRLRKRSFAEVVRSKLLWGESVREN